MHKTSSSPVLYPSNQGSMVRLHSPDGCFAAWLDSVPLLLLVCGCLANYGQIVSLPGNAPYNLRDY